LDGEQSRITKAAAKEKKNKKIQENQISPLTLSQDRRSYSKLKKASYETSRERSQK
jgi:hypothetical protein